MAGQPTPHRQYIEIGSFVDFEYKKGEICRRGVIVGWKPAGAEPLYKVFFGGYSEQTGELIALVCPESKLTLAPRPIDMETTEDPWKAIPTLSV